MAIRPKPNTDAHRALRLIVENPGDLTSADVAAHLWPPPKLGPFPALPSLAGLSPTLAPRDPSSPRPGTGKPPAAIVASEQGRRIRAAAEHVRKTEEKASRLIRQLGSAGFLLTGVSPTLAEWFVGNWTTRAELVREDWRARGLPARPSLAEAKALVLVALFEGQPQAPGLVEKVANLPPTVAAVLGAKPSGALSRAWGVLRDRGIVLTSSRRWPTLAGIELVNPKKEAA